MDHLNEAVEAGNGVGVYAALEKITVEDVECLLAEVEQLRAENAAMVRDAALGRAVAAIPEGWSLEHHPHDNWEYLPVRTVRPVKAGRTPGEALGIEEDK